MNSRSRQKLLFGLLGATAMAPLASQAATPLYRWEFDAGNGTPLTTAGGGILLPGGTANFLAAGVSGLPGDSALNVANFYTANTGTDGNKASATAANVLSGLGTLSSFTVTMWLNLTTGDLVTGKFPRILQAGTAANPDNTSPGFSFLLNSGNVEFGVNGRTAGLPVAEVSSANAGKWVFLAFCYDGVPATPNGSNTPGGNLELYGTANNAVILGGTTTNPATVRNSAGLALAAPNTTTSAGPVALGAATNLFVGDRGTNGRGLTGSIDDIRIHNTRLTVAEIEAIRLESAPPPTAGGVQHYWKGTTDDAWNASNWTLDAAGATAAVTIPADGTAGAVFAADGANIDPLILGSAQNIVGLKFNTRSAFTNLGILEIGGTSNLTLGLAGVTLDSDAGEVRINTSGQVILGANQTWKNQSALPFTTVSQITGGFNLTTAGTGAITLSGANLHTGGTTVESGRLNLGSATALGPINTTLVIGTGTLDLKGFSPVIGGLLGSGFITNTTEGTATLTLDDLLAAADNYTGVMTNGSPTQILAFTKDGPGTITLGGANAFTGDVNITEGTLIAPLARFGTPATSSLGNAQSAGRSVNVATGATLRFTSNNILGNAATNIALLPQINLNGGTLDSTRYNLLGNVTLNGGTLINSTTEPGPLYFGYQFRGTVAATGATVSQLTSPNSRGNHLDTDTPFSVDAGSELAISAPLLDRSGDFGTTALLNSAGGLHKLGAGKLTLAVPNSYTGPTRVEAGTLSITGDQSLSDTSPLTVFADAVLNIDFGTELVGSLILRDAEGNEIAQLFGTYGGPDSGADFPIATWTGSGVIRVSADPYASWLASFPGFSTLTLANRQKNADPDQDGLTNFAEFAFNGNPLTGQTSGKIRSRIEIVASQQALVITLPVRDDAVTLAEAAPSVTLANEFVSYTIEGTNELETFDQTVSEIGVIEEEALPTLDAGWMYRSFRLNGAIGGVTPRGPSGFLRAIIDQVFIP